jgi:hypothetical protein
MEYAARIAPEIDRLVLGVNRAADDRIRTDVAEMAAELGLDHPAWLKHYAEFLLEGALTEELAVVRLPYAADDAIAERLDTWRRLGLVAGPSGGIAATESLVPLLKRVLDARAGVGRAFWADAPQFASTADLVEQVVAAIPERFVLATAHRRLPQPADRFLGFHQRLTTLRYVRSQAHVAAWRSLDLTRLEIVAMTALWHGTDADPGAGLDGLARNGLALADGSGLTVDGVRMRQQIEADTNRTTEPVFRSLNEDDRENLLVGLAQLAAGA